LGQAWVAICMCILDKREHQHIHRYCELM
jgi:hypothetical protein